jgi:cytoskeletal protein RodZ
MALESENGSTLASGQANHNNDDSAMAARSRAFGEMFVQRRQRLGLTLQQVSSFTKLHPRFLKAIEQADFSKLPGGILSKSFIRSYAQEIGIDDSQAVSEYLAITGQTPPEPVLDPTTIAALSRDPIGENHAGKSHSGLLSIGLVALLFIIVSSGSFLLGRHYKGLLLLHSHSSPAAPPLSVESEVDSKAPADSAHAITAAPVATASPVTAASIQNPSTEASGSSSTSQADQDLTPKVNELTSEECAASTICVQINARENAWVSITVDGKVMMQSTLVAPTRKLIAAQRHLVVRAGNVGALDFRFNGVQLPTQGDYDEAKTLSFSPNGLEKRLPTPNPTTQTD